MKKVVVISGGSEGLGKAIAEKLASDNSVTILSRNEEKLKKTADQVGCDYLVCDVSQFEDCEKAIELIIKQKGQIDCLINNAGVWVEGKIDEVDHKKIREVLEVNSLGTIYLTKAVTPEMKKKASGLIVNVVSQAGLYARAERSVYAASKWAMTGFTKAVQAELAKYGIAVTGLYPGMIKTQLFENAGVSKDLSNGLEPEEIAKVIEFLLSFPNSTLFPEIGIKNINN